MASPLNTHLMRGSTAGDLSEYYKTLAHRNDVEQTTQQILQAIQRGSVPPTVFAPWLGIARSPSAIATALRQRFSVIVRKDAIKCLGKSLRSSRWEKTWEGLGGTAGLLEIFSDLSVHEVRQACKEIGRCGKGRDVQAKRKCITELLMGLQPQFFPDATFKTSDRRPLAKYYRHLLPSCEEWLVDRALFGDLRGTWQTIRDEYWMRYHPELMRKEQLRALQEGSPSAINEQRLEKLTNQYPKGVSTIPGFSASMDFSLSYLQDLVEAGSPRLDDYFVINNIARPLLHRAVKKENVWRNIEEIVDTIMRFLQKRPSAYKGFELLPGDIIHLVASCWASKQDLFEETLKILCSHPIYGISKYNSLTDWDDFLIGIPKPRRYALLRLCFKESTGLNIDDDNHLRKVKGGLSDDLLSKLNAKHALDLLVRMRNAKGDDDLVRMYRSNTILNVAPSFEGSGADPDMYQALLQNQAGRLDEARKLALQRVGSRERQAASASKPEQRAYFAQSAMYFAVASGSLSLYQETLKWTERFIRDPLVIRELYPRYYPHEVIKLLSGIPEQFDGSRVTSRIRERVRLCNTVLADMFDTACVALREPSFSINDWKGTFDIFQSVVKERIKQSKKLREALDLTDEETYSILWEHTTETLVALEEKANQSAFERLQMDAVRGPLDCFENSHLKLDTRERSTYRFFDNLAKARDALWQRLRPTVFPTVLTLPKALPRGLPLQHLTAPWVIDVQDLEGLAPYIASRVDHVVFQSPAETLQSVLKDDESASAIGIFVDSYTYALQLYIPESCGKYERVQRIQKAWGYAVGSLSLGRMSKEEAVMFWSGVASKKIPGWPPVPISSAKDRIWPLTPEVDDPSEPHAWNPFRSGRPDKESRSLGSLTYLDLALAVEAKTPNQAKLRSRMAEWGEPQVPADSVDTNTIWDSNRKLGEGGVLSALLYLEMKFGAPDGRLLKTPFPSKDDARYPSLYLDSEFEGELNHFTAVRSIKGHLDLMPPTLLQLFTRNMMAALAASEKDEIVMDSMLQELALTSIVRLAESDRPALAFKMALNTVLDRQGASSWHRQLLKPSWFRRLPAKDAQMCFEAFAEAVFERTETKSASLEQSDGSDEPDSLSASFVKVTTIKMLAQLLQGTEFVGDDTSFSVVSRLLERASHVDVRRHAVKGLLDMLEANSEAVVEQLLITLEALAPEAGKLRRHFPYENDNGQSIQAGLAPQEPIMGDDSSPVIGELIKYYQHGSIKAERFQAYVKRILLLALEHRIAQTAEWAKLFLKKHGKEDLDFDPPLEPEDAGNINEMLRTESDKSCYLPSILLDRSVSYTLFRLAPPTAIVKLNEKLRSDPALRSQRDVQTWLLLYGGAVNFSTQTSTFDILTLLDKPTRLPEATGITPNKIETHFLKLFTTVLVADAPTYTNLNRFLANIVKGTHLAKPWWSTHGEAIITAMIAYVDSLRTLEWECDPTRKPAVLPDTFPWRCLLLDYPWPDRNNHNQDTERKCKLFAEQLATLIDGMTGGIYHLELAQLKTYLALDPVSSTADRSVEKKIGHWTIFTQRRDALHDMLVANRIITACYLGDLTNTRLSWITKSDFVRIEVASYLLGLVGEEDWEKGVEKDFKDRVDGLVGQWKACQSEDVRRVGIEAERRLRFEIE
ncbi:hypothetical protein EK21DRAFT_70905 [Setomelanomma holmii]|uniref:Uncharacterized protein n=1 Tax=Setomelanomma holmii TaxID=210430 RepID=A0A9P4H4E8_9PLEO|nr:hypothetical protein EK21DRAFT_70905 [Setomelanomma holmii]